ncbi:MAG: tetratricopeptide repeat protein [Acidobacteriia bacterium]|nr:tetratricopeptide repeat protein [Terriglobia bacterium]
MSPSTNGIAVAVKRFMVVFALLAMSSLMAWAQQSTAPARGSGPLNVPLVTIRGNVMGDSNAPIPEILEVKLENIQGPVQETFIHGDHNFKFDSLPSGEYTVKIHDDKFEDVNQRVLLDGKISQEYYIAVVLTARKEQRTKAQALEADDELTNAVTVSLLLQKIPKKAMKLYRKSLDFHSKKQGVEEIATLKEALQVAPDFYSAQRNLGVAYYLAHQPDNAIAPLQAALKVNPKSTKVNLYLGLCYLNRKDFNSASSYFDKSAALSPERAAPFYFLGYVDYKLNRLDEAEKHLKRAMMLDPELGSYSRLQLTNIYIKQSQLTEAYQQLEGFLKEQPTAEEAAKVMHDMKILRDVMEATKTP